MAFTRCYRESSFDLFPTDNVASISMGLSSTTHPSKKPSLLTPTELKNGVQDVMTIHKAQAHDLLMSDSRWPSYNKHLGRPKPRELPEVE